MESIPHKHVLHPIHHAVRFYSHDDELFRTIATFLGEGLIDGQPALLIATPAHGLAVERALKDKLIDVVEARRMGDLVILDADETLATFMVGGMPDAALFRRNIGTVMTQVLRGRENTVLRAYGEMVDVLWKQGKSDAAIRLEVLWNELATQYAFSLLCGYAIGNFYKQSGGIDRVCEQHTHVTMPDSKVVAFEQPRAVAK
jgi:hypothetical protein